MDTEAKTHPGPRVGRPSGPRRMLRGRLRHHEPPRHTFLGAFPGVPATTQHPRPVPSASQIRAWC